MMSLKCYFFSRNNNMKTYLEYVFILCLRNHIENFENLSKKHTAGK